MHLDVDSLKRVRTDSFIGRGEHAVHLVHKPERVEEEGAVIQEDRLELTPLLTSIII